MKAILVFIDGTICDTRSRHHLIDTAAFYSAEAVRGDLAVPGSVACLQALTSRYQIVYIGARPEFARMSTEAWLKAMGYPQGHIYLAEDQAGRLTLVRALAARFDFVAGIGDRWDDNELHSELGCLSIILKEYEGAWDEVTSRIRDHYRAQKLKENETHLRGKVEGLVRVCPLLLARYGDELWDSYFGAVLQMAADSRDARRQQDMASLAGYGLNPADLRDIARWHELSREDEWEDNRAYGLQDFELVEATPRRFVQKVTRCLYAELWKAHGRPDIGYQIHCRTDAAWWDRPAWNPQVRFEQPATLMRGGEYCLFVQYLP